MEDKLNDTGNEKEDGRESVKKSNWPIQAKILIAIFLFVILALIVVILIIIFKEDKNEKDKKDDDEEQKRQREILEKAGYIETWNNLYGIRMENLLYGKNDTIINSFKKDGDNYNETIGEINNGEDYPVNERNKYTMYIPYSSLSKTNKYNGILLLIHGGSWIEGVKEDIEFLSSRYAKMGYITATMGYTVLSGEYPNYNIYRILDEITTCIENIKDQLEKLNFNTSKLEIALGGISAGAHIALLYGYSIKKTPIPIKFLITSFPLSEQTYLFLKKVEVPIYL